MVRCVFDPDETQFESVYGFDFFFITYMGAARPSIVLFLLYLMNLTINLPSVVAMTINKSVNLLNSLIH